MTIRKYQTDIIDRMGREEIMTKGMYRLVFGEPGTHQMQRNKRGRWQIVPSPNMPTNPEKAKSYFRGFTNSTFDNGEK